MRATTLGLAFYLAMGLLFLTGCASMQPLSNYARPGDTVIVSLGGTESNAVSSIVSQENLLITLTDSGNNAYPVKVRNVFRVYGDPTSRYGFNARTPGTTYFESVVGAHQGLWLAVIDLVDVSDNPLPLTTGIATLSVSSPDLVNSALYWNLAWTNGDLGNIPIEILGGTGSPNPLNYLSPISHSPLDSLQPNPQVEITVSGTPSAPIGGGQFRFSYVNADFGDIFTQPYVVTTTPDPNVQISFNRQDQGDGTSLLQVHIINPHGFNTDNSKPGLVEGRSLFSSLRFQLVWGNPAVDDSNWQNSVQLLSSEYFDLSGNPMPEISPVLTKVR